MYFQLAGYYLPVPNIRWCSLGFKNRTYWEGRSKDSKWSRQAESWHRMRIAKKRRKVESNPLLPAASYRILPNLKNKNFFAFRCCKRPAIVCYFFAIRDGYSTLHYRVVLVDKFAVAQKVTHSCCIVKYLLYIVCEWKREVHQKCIISARATIHDRRSISTETQPTANPRGGGQDQLV